MTDPAAQTRRAHAPAVLANRVTASRRWGRPYLAYHACVRPEPAEAAALSAMQDAVLRREPSLLRVPEAAMHANIAWLLPGHREFGRPKDEIWRERGPGWMAALAEAAASARIRLRLRALVATDSAIIAVADEPNGASALRRRLSARLGVPGGISAGNLVHLTLFRYAGPLRAPAALLEFLAAPGLDAEVRPRELLVVREEVFPSLACRAVGRFPLGRPGQPG